MIHNKRLKYKRYWAGSWSMYLSMSMSMYLSKSWSWSMYRSGFNTQGQSYSGGQR
jgi:hypothetical protein